MRQSEFFKEYGELIISALAQFCSKENTKDVKEIIKVIQEKISDTRIIELEEAVVRRNWEDIYNGFTEEEKAEYDKLVYGDD